MDSTICDFMSPWMQWLVDNNYTNTLYSVEDITDYNWMFDKFGNNVKDYFTKDPLQCYSSVKEYPGFLEFILWLYINYDVEILTHSWSKKTEFAKRKWLTDRVPIDLKINFYSELNEKFKLTKNAILIDDYPLHILKHNIENKGLGIIFDFNGKNAWSKIEKYSHFTDNENYNENLTKYATNYSEVKQKLFEFLKN